MKTTPAEKGLILTGPEVRAVLSQPVSSTPAPSHVPTPDPSPDAQPEASQPARTQTIRPGHRVRMVWGNERDATGRPIEHAETGTVVEVTRLGFIVAVDRAYGSPGRPLEFWPGSACVERAD